jgi:hypothetical protein
MRIEFIPSLLSDLVAIARQISPLVHILAVVWLVLLFWKRSARLLVVRACGLISALDLLFWALPRCGVAEDPPTIADCQRLTRRPTARQPVAARDCRTASIAAPTAEAHPSGRILSR